MSHGREPMTPDKPTPSHPGSGPVATTMDSPAPLHGLPGHQCNHCMVDLRRNRSNLVAWIVAALAVAFALLVYFSRAGSVGSNVGGLGSVALIGILVCPLIMGTMMWMMMRKGH